MLQKIVSIYQPTPCSPWMAEQSPSWLVLSKTVRAIFYSFNLLLIYFTEHLLSIWHRFPKGLHTDFPLDTGGGDAARADSSGRLKDWPWGRSSGRSPTAGDNFHQKGMTVSQPHCRPTCLAFSWLNGNCASPSQITFGSDGSFSGCSGERGQAKIAVWCLPRDSEDLRKRTG